MKKLKKSQFSYDKYVPAGKDVHRSEPYADVYDSYNVHFVDENNKKITAEIKDIYILNVFQFFEPKQEDLIKAKKWIIENSKNEF